MPWMLVLMLLALLAIGAAAHSLEDQYIDGRSAHVPPQRPLHAESGSFSFSRDAHTGIQATGGAVWPPHATGSSRRLSQAQAQKRFQSHRQELPDLSAGPQVLFQSNQARCTKPNQQSVGPYFVDGQFVRKDLSDNQGGVNLTLHLQFVDQSCSPMQDLYVDLWHANASGVYSGVQAVENANGADLTQTNFHRGVSQTDRNGLVTFITKIPGNYVGRTTHLHVLTTRGGTLNTNGTLGTDYMPVQNAQIFFDQDLLNEVNALEPYSSSTTALTANKDDYLYTIFTNRDIDPHLIYALQGSDISQGILGWVRIGVDLATVSQNILTAGTLGVPNNGGPRPIVPTAPPEAPWTPITPGPAGEEDAASGAQRLKPWVAWETVAGILRVLARGDAVAAVVVGMGSVVLYFVE